MNSRMNKYYEDDRQINTRYKKNADLYNEISKSELNNYEVKSNSTIIGENNNEIDVEKIKKILDTKYNSVPKRRSIRIEQTEEEDKKEEITKEYDINVVLEKAREQKTDNYEEERLKKLKDTQFDILKNLNIERKDDKEEENVEENLKNLINTITINEKNSSTSASLDILSDLKGSENTEVLDGLKEEIEDKEKDIDSDRKMIDSFYTSSNALKERDFEDIEDFSKSIESNNNFLKIIVTIIILVFIVGVILLIKTFFFS